MRNVNGIATSLQRAIYQLKGIGKELKVAYVTREDRGGKENENALPQYNKTPGSQ